MTTESLNDSLGKVKKLLEERLPKKEPSVADLAGFGATVAKSASRHFFTKPPIAQENSDPAPEGSKKIYASDIGKQCLRQIWYKSNWDDKFPDNIDYNVRWRFLTGDLMEAAVLFAAEQAGCKVEYRQAPVKSEINSVTFSGKIDAVIDGVLVDVKTMSDYAYCKFYVSPKYPSVDNDPWGYGFQLAFYATYSPFIDKGKAPHFIGINKVTGEMHAVKLNSYFIDNLEFRMSALVDAVNRHSPFDLPALLPLEDKMGTRLPSPCNICKYLSHCRAPESPQGFRYSHGVEWYVKLKGKTPKVPAVAFPPMPPEVVPF